MRKLWIPVLVENRKDFEADPIEYELFIDIREVTYNKLIPICQKIEEEGLEDDETNDLLKEEAPEVQREIESAIEIAMPGQFNLQKDESIDDFIFEPEYSHMDLM